MTQTHDTHRFTGRTEFHAHIKAALQRAHQDGSNELWLTDASFEDWPLGERDVIASLQAWASGARKLNLLAKRFEPLQRSHHRFVAWRVQWAHIIEARAIPSADALDFPSAILTSAWALQRLDPERCTGFVSTEPVLRVALRESLQEHWARATPAFAASTLGL
jgi:PIN domain nuclease of toxin-antitoxin system